MDKERDRFTAMCSVMADTSTIARSLRLRAPGGGDYYSLEFDVVLLFVLTELKAQIYRNDMRREAPLRLCTMLMLSFSFLPASGYQFAVTIAVYVQSDPALIPSNLIRLISHEPIPQAIQCRFSLPRRSVAPTSDGT
ncbi:hypothetical protein HD554DRAFT_1152851 [Boletus coccyginus]|nr:hypothetical protein HD554DRAFT_1152851 [Boletus coccyginus]